MTGRLAGKVAVVTGAASGIGRAIALRYGTEGARVVLGDLDGDGAAAVAEEAGNGSFALACDVTDESAVEALVQAAVERTGRLDVVVANAGAGGFGTIVDLDLEEWRRIVDLCLTGVFLTLKHGGRQMAATGTGGSAIIVASLNAVQPAAGMAPYCAAKAGAAMLAQVAAMELGPHGIRVNTIAPGLVETAATSLFFQVPGVVEEFVENTTVGRYAQPEDVAAVAMFLASDEASFVSAGFYSVDGGARTKRYPDLPARFARARPDRTLTMRFGVFLPPMHKVGLSPHLALKRDLQLVRLLDELGYEEVWIGEHHSGGSELIASPEVFIAAAAEQTRHIRLGTGVSSLPYHHPFMLADRFVLLDHLTEGRAMLGVGPGQLTSDAQMLGIDPSTQRPRMEEAFDVMMRLFRGEHVTEDAGWFRCVDASLQMRPYSDFEIVVAASISPSGSKLAGRYGTGLLSIAATNPTGVEMLAGHWKVAEEQAVDHGTAVDRDRWRLMGPMHIARTFEEAKENCRHGLAWVFDYLSHVIPLGGPMPTDYDELVDAMNEQGQAIIGTPEMAVAQIQRLQEKSGGFGCYLHMGADFAEWPATVRHYELFAEEVAPHFTGQLEPVVAGYEKVMGAGDTYVNATLTAQLESVERYQKEREGRSGAGS